MNLCIYLLHNRTIVDPMGIVNTDFIQTENSQIFKLIAFVSLRRSTTSLDRCAPVARLPVNSGGVKLAARKAIII